MRTGTTGAWPRGQARRRAYLWAGRILVVAAFIALWEVASGWWLDPFWISTPRNVWHYLVAKWQAGVLQRNTLVTLRELAIGYGFGVIVGLPAAALIVRSGIVSEILDPFITAVNGIPRVAIGPLMIIWFGIGIESKVVLVASLVVFLVFFNTYAGFRAVPYDYIRTARSLGATAWQIHRKVELPAASPWILTGLKIGIPYGLIGAIVGEFIASSQGLGYMIQYESNLYNATGSIAVILVLTAIVVVLNAVLDLIDRRLLRWRPARGDSTVQMTL